MSLSHSFTNVLSFDFSVYNYYNDYNDYKDYNDYRDSEIDLD